MRELKQKFGCAGFVLYPKTAAYVEGFTARSAGQGATGKANSPRHFCQLKNWLSDSVAVPHGTTSESSQLGGPIHIQQSPTGSHDMSIGWHSGQGEPFSLLGRLCAPSGGQLHHRSRNVSSCLKSGRGLKGSGAVVLLSAA